MYEVVRLALRYVLGECLFGQLQGNQRGVRKLASQSKGNEEAVTVIGLLLYVEV